MPASHGRSPFRRPVLLRALLLGCTAALLAQEPAPPSLAPVPATGAAVTRTGDGGLLEYAWFGSELDLTNGHKADAFWIKPGLSLRDRTIIARAWDTKVLQAGRQPKDLDRAKALSVLMQDALLGSFQRTFKNHCTWQVGGKGDCILEGRVVDANVPNTASKLVFGWLGGKDNLDNVTYDLKLTDSTTGETLLALHHRVVKVNSLGSLDASLRRWCEDFSRELFALAP